MRSALARAIFAPLPSVPSLVPIFKTQLTQTVDETVTTWTGVDIGTPHPNRLVILAGSLLSNSTGITVGSLPASVIFRSSANNTTIWAVRIPAGSTADVVATCSTAVARKAISIYVAYPNNPSPLDAAEGTANGVVTVSDVKAQPGGFLIGAYGGATTSASVAWSGPDALVDDANTFVESVADAFSFHVNVTAGSDLDDIVVTPNTGGAAGRAVVVSWGPPAP